MIRTIGLARFHPKGENWIFCHKNLAVFVTG
jgi:hypothetical protein